MSAPDFLNIIAPPAWTTDALCAQVDPELFYPETGAPNRDAKRVCGGCNVRAECLAYAIAHRERFGVWGGTTERERRRLRRAPATPAPDRRTGVIRQLATTLTDPEIAARLGCSARTVLRIRGAAGIPPARNRLGAA
jgi:hypothetical protein